MPLDNEINVLIGSNEGKSEALGLLLLLFFFLLVFKISFFSQVNDTTVG